MFDIFLKWHTQKYYILVLTNVVLHFIVVFVVLNEINVCGGCSRDTYK